MAGEIESGAGDGGALATWVVQISALGAEALDVALASTKDRLEAVDAGAKSAASNVTRAMAGAAAQVERTVAAIQSPKQVTIRSKVEHEQDAVPPPPVVRPAARPTAIAPIPQPSPPPTAPTSPESPRQPISKQAAPETAAEQTRKGPSLPAPSAGDVFQPPTAAPQPAPRVAAPKPQEAPMPSMDQWDEILKSAQIIGGKIVVKEAEIEKVLAKLQVATATPPAAQKVQMPAAQPIAPPPAVAPAPEVSQSPATPPAAQTVAAPPVAAIEAPPLAMPAPKVSQAAAAPLQPQTVEQPAATVQPAPAATAPAPPVSQKPAAPVAGQVIEAPGATIVAPDAAVAPAPEATQQPAAPIQPQTLQAPTANVLPAAPTVAPAPSVTQAPAAPIPAQTVAAPQPSVVQPPPVAMPTKPAPGPGIGQKAMSALFMPEEERQRAYPPVAQPPSPKTVLQALGAAPTPTAPPTAAQAMSALYTDQPAPAQKAAPTGRQAMSALGVEPDAEPQAAPKLATPGTDAFAGLPAVLQQVQKEMLAVEKNASGIEQALELARDKLDGFSKAGVSGIAPIKGQLAAIEQAFKGQLVTAETAQKGIATVMGATTTAAGRQLGTLSVAQGVLAGGYALLTSKLLGFVRAGMEGTNQAMMLSYWTQQLNREIANIFAPAINAVIDKMGQLVNWFRNLSGSGQAIIRNLSAMGLAFTAIGAFTPVVKMLASNIALVGKALASSFAAHPILAAAAAVGVMLMGTEKGRAAIVKIGEAVSPLISAFADIAGAMSSALQPVLEAVAVAVGAIATAIKPVLEVIAAIVEFVGPMAAYSAVFYAIGAAGVWAFSTTSGYIVTVTAQMGGLTAATVGAAGAFTALGTAIKAAMASLGPIGWIAIGLGAVVGLFSGLFSKKKDDKARTGVSAAAGSFESVDATFRNIQQNANRGDVAQRTREQQLATLAQIARNTGRATTVPAIGA